MVVDKGQMSVAELAKITGVSEVTIRQDLNTLEKQSYLRRAHGFAVSLESDDVETRIMTNYIHAKTPTGGVRRLAGQSWGIRFY